MVRTGSFSVRRRFPRWALRLAAFWLLGFCAVYWAARNGKLSSRGYDLVYMTIAGPPALLGASERTVVLRLYDINCGGYRYPYDVLWMSEGRGLPETVQTLFTCRPVRSERFRSAMQGRR